MANNPNHMANLRSFPKGQSGNPAGRPAIPKLDAIICDEIGEDGIREIVRALHAAALKGNIRAMEVLIDRIYGKAKDITITPDEATVDDARAYLIDKLLRNCDNK